FVGGVKIDPATGSPTVAGGVLDEFEAAKAADCFMIPIASTGGAAARISELLTGSAVETSGRDAMRPTDDELGELARADITVEEVVKLVAAILTRIDKRI
ncbi:hypothetical protein ACNJIQ_21010, partial [Mycobacterium tuberculosis]